MFKYSKYIIGLIFFSIFILGTGGIAYAQEGEAAPGHIESELSPAPALEEEAPRQPVIPKPKTLPGPQERTQAEGGEAVRSFVFRDLIPNFLKGFLGISGATAVIFLIVGGIQFLTAFGSEEKLGSAKKTITWAVVGLLLSILSYAIVTIITRLPLPTERGGEAPRPGGGTEEESQFQLEEPGLHLPPEAPSPLDEPNLDDYEFERPDAETPEGYLPDANRRDFQLHEPRLSP